MKIKEPFHEGELQVQKKAGEEAIAQRNGVVIANEILRGGLPFIRQQPMVVLGSVDELGSVWASILTGDRGFMDADEHSLELNLTRVDKNPEDPFWTNIKTDRRLGVLVIDLGTRRRLRINGEVSAYDQEKIQLSVIESYPNCPKYIQRRHVLGTFPAKSSPPTKPQNGTSLTADQQRFITQADTFFIASLHPQRGIDASHRGGNPGFISILNEKKIRIPDYSGNSLFNTLGNLTSDPRAGLIFLDFDRGRTLQLVGHGEIQWDQEDSANKTGGTKRFWNFAIERWLELDLPRPLEWEFLDSSPFNP
ncbi:MAG: pyridoxamine 5'-phosphate oxidase [Elusimicrobia bacterium]|nr:MAG: pyridoxamine 5'-phosphate oxidase [Elusimicrobiota bacterium]